MAQQSFFSKLFSSPISGLDIADQSVKYVTLVPSENGYEISNYGNVQLPEGIIVDGNITDPRRLSTILSDIREKGDLHHVRVSLPTSHSFIVENAGLNPVSHHLRGEALVRSLLPKNHAMTSMLVNFGETQSDLAVVHKGKVYAAKSFALPNELTKDLMETFSISLPEAKNIKRSIGLSRRPEHEHIFAALLSHISSLAQELDAAFIEWHTHPTEKRPRIQEIILVGSNAHIEGLPEYLSAALRTNVRLGNPWQNINSLNGYTPPLHAEDALGYAAAFGLALEE